MPDETTIAPDTDYRSLRDTPNLGAWDLKGADVTVTIARVIQAEVFNAGKSKKLPAVYFEGAEKRLPLNATNARTIAGLYGPRVGDWVGKKVTLYPTTTQMAGDTKDCIRIRNKVPA